MSEQIKDGTGDGFLARVNSDNRLHTSSVIQAEEAHSNHVGDAYNINTGIITLTDAADTPVIYMKNNEIREISITAIAVGLAPSTGGTGGIPIVTVIRNPTAGTIISSPTNVDINSNRNYGSAKTLTVDAYKGATGDTMTDGEDHILLFQAAGGRLFAAIDEIITPGKSIGIKIQPQTSNTSMDVYAALICYLTNENSEDK